MKKQKISHVNHSFFPLSFFLSSPSSFSFLLPTAVYEQKNSTIPPPEFLLPPSFPSLPLSLPLLLLLLLPSPPPPSSPLPPLLPPLPPSSPPPPYLPLIILSPLHSLFSHVSLSLPPPPPLPNFFPPSPPSLSSPPSPPFFALLSLSCSFITPSKGNR